MSTGVGGPTGVRDHAGKDHAGKGLADKDATGKGLAGKQASFKDHFSVVADAYAAARPEYPEALFDALAVLVPRCANVWEPGCGSGQATRGLAARFVHVHASDPSAEQIARHWAAAAAAPVDGRAGFDPPSRRAAATPAGGRAGFNPPSRDPPSRDPRRVETRPTNVSLAVEPGERTGLPDASVQLVAVAQALHWFDRGRFFAQCERVLVPGGVLAAWGYADFLAPEGMVDAVAAFRAQIEPHWPPERAQIDAHYAGYDWPFPALPTPALRLEAEWSLAHFMRYLSSMSASARCLAATGDDPVARHAAALTAAWGAAGDLRTLQWPLFVHLRRKP